MKLQRSTKTQPLHVMLVILGSNLSHSTPELNPLAAVQLGDPAQILPLPGKIQLKDNVLQIQKMEEAGEWFFLGGELHKGKKLF